MKKAVFSVLAVAALVISFANVHPQHQASVVDPIPSSVVDPIPS